MPDTEFSPKSEFLLRHKKMAEELQANRQAGWFTTGASFALAQMAFSGASAEKLAGAREFISELQNLYDASKGPERLPVKRLGDYPPELQEQGAQQSTKKK